MELDSKKQVYQPGLRQIKSDFKSLIICKGHHGALRLLHSLLEYD